MIAKPSKSASKREHLALQALGCELIGLTQEQLDEIDLDERLRDAVTAARTIHAHGALRRQKQLIGKLMRNVDPAPIREALDRFGSSDRLEKRIFREAEQWRDRITGQDPGVLAEFVDYLGCDCDALADEVKTYQSATHDRARKQARRRIFSQIHKEIARKVQNNARSI